jgi:hypothetical protein
LNNRIGNDIRKYCGLNSGCDFKFEHRDQIVAKVKRPDLFNMISKFACPILITMKYGRNVAILYIDR